MKFTFTESVVEEAALVWLEAIGWRDSLARFNPALSSHTVYEENTAFSDTVAKAHRPIRMLDVEFMPGEALYETKSESYFVNPREFDADDADTVSGQG